LQQDIPTQTAHSFPVSDLPSVPLPGKIEFPKTAPTVMVPVLEYFDRVPQPVLPVTMIFHHFTALTLKIPSGKENAGFPIPPLWTFEA
jgi:hypothetical protein